MRRGRNSPLLPFSSLWGGGGGGGGVIAKDRGRYGRGLPNTNLQFCQSHYTLLVVLSHSSPILTATSDTAF